MLKKVVTAVLSAVMILNSVSLFAVAAENKDSVSLTDVELLLEKQKMEFERNVVIYSAVGAGAVTVAGGIYAYYTQKHISTLKRNNKILSDKLSQAETLVNAVAKEMLPLIEKLPKMQN